MKPCLLAPERRQPEAPPVRIEASGHLNHGWLAFAAGSISTRAVFSGRSMFALTVGPIGQSGVMTTIEPTLDQLTAVFRENPQEKADTSLEALRVATGGVLDLNSPQHRCDLLHWLNKWLCRIRYPRDGEPDLFGESLLAWHNEYPDLPESPVAEITSADVATLAEAYSALAASPATPRRTIGPTASSKILFALRPDTIPPWDRRIARETVRGVTRAHFAVHLSQGQAWAAATLVDAATRGITDVPAHVGRPASSLAKIWDEWHYLTITRAARLRDATTGRGS